MSNTTIPQVYVDGFRDAVRHLAQQKYSKLRAYTDQFSPEAETGNWDRLSSGEAAAKTRVLATPETGRTWSRRIAVATPFSDAEITEVEDPSMMLIDPNSNIVRSIGMSMGRNCDDVIISAALGGALNSVRASDGSNTPTTVALGAGQTIGDGTTPMSFDLVTQTQKYFMDSDIDPDMPKIFVVGPRQIQELMNLTEQTSSDYVQAQALQSYGIVPNWLGFTWIASTRLSAANGAHPATGQRYCFACTTDALGYHVPQDVTTFVERDPSLSYAWRPYAQITHGAVRLEEASLARVHVADVDVP
jgi:hypothetical protein